MPTVYQHNIMGKTWKTLYKMIGVLNFVWLDLGWCLFFFFFCFSYLYFLIYFLIRWVTESWVISMYSEQKNKNSISLSFISSTLWILAYWGGNVAAKLLEIYWDKSWRSHWKPYWTLLSGKGLHFNLSYD